MPKHGHTPEPPRKPPNRTYEVWRSGDGKLWSGEDPEEAILIGMKARTKFNFIEVIERENGYSKRIAHWGTPPEEVNTA